MLSFGLTLNVARNKIWRFPLCGRWLLISWRVCRPAVLLIMLRWGLYWTGAPPLYRMEAVDDLFISWSTVLSPLSSLLLLLLLLLELLPVCLLVSSISVWGIEKIWAPGPLLNVVDATPKAGTCHWMRLLSSYQRPSVTCSWFVSRHLDYTEWQVQLWFIKLSDAVPLSTVFGCQNYICH